ncbi:MAG: hypothetical protein ABSB15_18880 [Bryobacteraceae bacterium]|jgi:hypothetical protein
MLSTPPPPSPSFVSIWVPIIAAVLGALIGAIGNASAPVIAEWLRNRLFGRQRALADSLISQAEDYKERESKLTVFTFELSHDPPPDVFKRQILLSRLELMDRREGAHWIMNDADIGMLKQWAERAAAQCRENAAQLSRWAERVGDKTFFSL